MGDIDLIRHLTVDRIVNELTELANGYHAEAEAMPDATNHEVYLKALRFGMSIGVLSALTRIDSLRIGVTA